MKHIKFAISLFLLSIFSIGLIYAQKSDKASPKKGYKLVWADEFDYQGLPDAKKWSYDTLGNNSGWGNNEAQFYTAGRKKMYGFMMAFCL